MTTKKLGCWNHSQNSDLVLVSLGMLLDESEAPMDFSRGSELSEFQQRRTEMEQLQHRKPELQNFEIPKSDNEVPRGLDLSHSVLDRLSQKVIRLGRTKLAHRRHLLIFGFIKFPLRIFCLISSVSEPHLYFEHNSHVLSWTEKLKIFGMHKFYVDTQHPLHIQIMKCNFCPFLGRPLTTMEMPK